MTFFDKVLVTGILFSIFILLYCKITKKTLTDIVKELRDVFKPEELKP